MPSAKPKSELELLRSIRARAAAPGSGLRLGIGDDCALLSLKPGEEAAVTTDLSIAGRHFELAWHPPEAVGHRALARGLSDLAAMGARPVAAFLSLGLPQSLTRAHGRQPAWVDRFYTGLLALAARHHCPLAGGDLAQSPVTVADIVLVGAVRRGYALLRSGARPGHRLFVTGTLGGAALGLDRLRHWAKAGGKRLPVRLQVEFAAHLAPEPRLPQGAWLVRHAVASAAIDLSDGLSTDLAHLCEESGVSAEVDAARLPLAPGATLAQALHGGEDYELLFAAHPSARIPRRIAGVQVTEIGRFLRRGAPSVTLITGSTRARLAPQGWEHFW